MKRAALLFLTSDFDPHGSLGRSPAPLVPHPALVLSLVAPGHPTQVQRAIGEHGLTLVRGEGVAWNKTGR